MDEEQQKEERSVRVVCADWEVVGQGAGDGDAGDNEPRQKVGAWTSHGQRGGAKGGMQLEGGQDPGGVGMMGLMRQASAWVG